MGHVRQRREMHTRFWWRNLTLWNVGRRWEDNLKNWIKKRDARKWTGLVQDRDT